MKSRKKHVVESISLFYKITNCVFFFYLFFIKQEAENDDDDDMGGPPEKKGKLEIVKSEPKIKEEPIETGHFHEKSINNSSDTGEQNSEADNKPVKADEIKSKPFAFKSFLTGKMRVSCFI